jgi:hypothetical protein
LENLEEYKQYRITTGRTILFEEQVYIPKYIRNQVVQARYRTILYRYPGIGKTIELVSRMFYFPGIKKVVKKVINTKTIVIETKQQDIYFIANYTYWILPWEYRNQS